MRAERITCGFSSKISFLVMLEHCFSHFGIENISKILTVDNNIILKSDSVINTIFRIVDVRTCFLIILTAHEQEQFILDNRSADSKAISLGKLRIIFSSFYSFIFGEFARSLSDKVLIIEIGVESSLYSVGS